MKRRATVLFILMIQCLHLVSTTRAAGEPPECKEPFVLNRAQTECVCGIPPTTNSSCLYGKLNEIECKCICAPQWDGPLCDQCLKQKPCVNGGEMDIHHLCGCRCPPPYYGELCQHCNTSQLQCGLGAADRTTCGCLCPRQLTGDHCETCRLQCHNGGLLTQHDNGDCSCQCQGPFSGQDCSLWDFSKVTCLNGGDVNAIDRNCSCQGSWGGPDCGQCSLGVSNISRCQNGVSLDHANCLCLCQRGFAGVYCQTAITQYYFEGLSPVLREVHPAVLVAVLALAPFVVMLIFRRRKQAPVVAIVSASDLKKPTLKGRLQQILQGSPSKTAIPSVEQLSCESSFNGQRRYGRLLTIFLYERIEARGGPQAKEVSECPSQYVYVFIRQTLNPQDRDQFIRECDPLQTGKAIFPQTKSELVCFVQQWTQLYRQQLEALERQEPLSSLPKPVAEHVQPKEQLDQPVIEELDH